MSGSPYRAFTVKSNGGVLRALVTRCQCCAAFDPRTLDPSLHPELKQFQAIWDTGATGSVITQNVVDACGLKPTGMTMVRGVHGSQPAETYLVNILLPNGVGFVDIEVTKAELGDVDMLIGMDIINRGDFSVSSFGGITTFSFRVPAIAAIDYVERWREAQNRTRGGGKPHKRPPKQFGKNKHRR